MALNEPNIDRLLKTFRFERTDRVPNFELTVESRSVQHLIGVRLRSGSLLFPDKVHLAQKTGTDAIIVSASKELGQIRQAEPDGFSFYRDGTIKSLPHLAVYDLGALLHQWSQETEAAIRQAIEAIRGTNLGVAVSIPGPLYPTYLSIGLIDFMVKLTDDPELVARLLDFNTEWACEVARLTVKHAASFAILGEDLAHTTGLLVSPRYITEQWMPRARRITEILHQGGVPCAVHSCGKLEKVLPWLVELGCVAVHPLQPQCNDIYAVRRQYGRQIALVGNIDITYPLSMGTPEDVRRDTLEHLEQLAPEGGYVVSSGHSIINSVPPENYLAMIETTWEWRRAAQG